MKLETLSRLHRVACERLEGEYAFMAIFNIGNAVAASVLNDRHPEEKYCEIRAFLSRMRWHFKQARFAGHLRKRDGRFHF